MPWNRLFPNPAHEKWAAGVWHPRDGFEPWSYHVTKEKAFSAARRYARQLQKANRTAGDLSWAGGVRYGGVIYWVDGRGAVIRSEKA